MNQFQSDLQTYQAICREAAQLYETIGTDRAIAIQKRNERWDVNRRKREAAENVIMSVIGEHKPALQRAGLIDFYNELAAGKGSSVAMFEIVDATVKYYSSCTTAPAS